MSNSSNPSDTFRLPASTNVTNVTPVSTLEGGASNKRSFQFRIFYSWSGAGFVSVELVLVHQVASFCICHHAYHIFFITLNMLFLHLLNVNMKNTRTWGNWSIEFVVSVSDVCVLKLSPKENSGNIYWCTLAVKVAKNLCSVFIFIFLFFTVVYLRKILFQRCYRTRYAKIHVA